MGEVPFREVFIHPKILDGYGETMSKSKGNGVDPLDVIDKFGADALRFGMAHLTTETQDVRMPVQFECPHCEALIEQTKKNRELPRIAMPQVRPRRSRRSGPQRRGPGAAARAGRQRTVRSGPQLLQQAVERLAVRADQSEGYTPGPVADASWRSKTAGCSAGWRR
jgi:valyl-tRNA synthetase